MKPLCLKEQAGLLPPVEDRLPENPLWITPSMKSVNMAEPGYGGLPAVTGDMYPLSILPHSLGG